jgi:hypothetical protein
VGYQTTFLVAGLVGAVGVAVAWRAPEPADAVDAART